MENATRRTRISDGTVTEYTWDHRNRLTKVTELDELGGNVTKEVDYTYDVNNRLVGKILDPDGEGEEEASEEYYAYDQTPFWTRGDSSVPSPFGRGAGGEGGEGSQMLFRFTGPTVDDLADRYLWAPVVDMLLSDEKLTGPSTPGDIYWTLGDNLNTVRDIARYNPATDTTTIVNHRTFDAFGNITSETNPAVDLLFAFTGRLFDESTGLQNNLNRWYDPTVGRWLSEDPMSFSAGDANLNRYVNNAPTYSIDPTGMDGTVPSQVDGYMVWVRWAQGVDIPFTDCGAWGQPRARSSGRAYPVYGSIPSVTTTVTIWGGNVCNTINGSFSKDSGTIVAKAYLPAGRYRITWAWHVSGTTTTSSTGGSLNVEGTSEGPGEYHLNCVNRSVCEGKLERTVVSVTSPSGGGRVWVPIAKYEPVLTHQGPGTGTTTATGSIVIYHIDKLVPPSGSGGSGGAH